MTRSSGSPLWRAATALLALAVVASAQQFHYQGFQTTPQLHLVGDATTANGRLRLTANSSNQTGWAWREGRIPIANGFSTTFSFRLVPTAIGSKGEGCAFVLHNDLGGQTAQGGTAWGLGYGLGASAPTGIIRNAVAIEIDTFRDAFLGDTSANELSIHVSSQQAAWEHEDYSIARTTPTTDLADGNLHTLRIDYAAGQWQLFLDGNAQPELTASYDLTTGGQYLNGQFAPPAVPQATDMFCGFAAATGAGALTELCEIASWQWTGDTTSHPCVLGSLGEDVLFVDEQIGDEARDLQLAIGAGFDITIAPPGTFGPGAPYVLFGSLTPLAPAPGSPGTQLGFGETCFPVLPMSPSELVLGDSLGVFGGLLPAGPAPFTFAIPPFVVNGPFELTLQAVIAASTSPLQFGVSNAIALEWAPGPPPQITGIGPLGAAPGTEATIFGSGFQNGAAVTVAGAPVPVTSLSATEIGFTMPVISACDTPVQVVNPDGQSANGAVNRSPVITVPQVGSGPVAGGNSFAIIGTFFQPPMTVTIGGNPASITTETATVMVVVAPPGNAGAQPLVITTPSGCSASTTYVYQ